jgi:hypothetical protein
MARWIALSVVVIAACGQPPVAAHSPATTPTPRAVHPLPSPNSNPAYPPANLGDVVALADRGVARRFIGAETQPVDNCAREWNKVYEPDGTPPRQIAADLVKVAIDRRAIFESCGGFVYGTTNRAFCNCYTGDHGLLVIDRGPGYEPATGKMRLTFSVSDTVESAGDWSAVLDAPDR